MWSVQARCLKRTFRKFLKVRFRNCAKMIIDIMDEYLKEIGNSNRSRYVEKLIEEDLKERGIKIDKKF